MTNVVHLSSREPERLIWRCNCGCSTHYAYEDGAVECANCGNVASGMSGEWRKPLPAKPASPENVEGGDANIVDMHSAPAAVKRMLDMVEIDETAAIVIMRHDGSVSAWGQTIEAGAQSKWFMCRAREALDLLRGNLERPDR